MSEFVSLDRLLRRPPPPCEPEAAPPPPPPEIEEEGCEEREAAIAAVRRFRAALDDALETRVGALLREIAVAVVARELALAPADVAAIVRAVRDAYALEGPLRVRANPADLDALQALGVPVVSDSSLRRGDVEIDVREGTIDATLGARLEAVLPC